MNDARVAADAQSESDSTGRMLDVLVIGAGFGGLCMAAKAKRAGLDVLVLERADEVGGTWRENTYPGCACDTQAHHYSLSFAPNPDWSRRYAPQAEILAYLKGVARDFGLLPLIRFGETAEELDYDEDRAAWTVATAGGQRYRARFVVSAVGQLNQPSKPDIPGLDAFSGVVMHSAEWDHAYDFAGKSLAVIGSGASAIQLIPPLAEQARRLTVFQRSPHWIVPKDDRAFAPWEKRLFRLLPPWALLYRGSIYWSWERSWPTFLEGSKQAVKRTREIAADIRSKVAAPALAKTLTPEDPYGCKRVLLADNYFPALKRDTVTVVTDPIARIEGNAVVTGEGGRTPVDCIVLATGFKSHDFLPGMTVRGREGAKLHELWAELGGTEAYLGIAMPGFPNLFLLYGPNTNLGHNSIVFMLECQVHYVMAAIEALGRRGARSLEVTEAAKAAYDQTLRRELGRTAWAGSCTSWYKTEQGKIVNNWSTNTVKYWRRTRRPKLAHYILR